jgi:hypothetical protein
MRLTALVLMLSIFALGADEAIAQEATAWRQVAEAIPLGSKVRVQTTDGRRLTGTLMRVDDTGVLVKKTTRLPEPAATVAYADLSRLERDHGNGVNIGKAIAIGLASGAGVIVGLILFAMQLD